MRKPNEVALLLRLLDESYEKKAWQGPNLRGALRGVTPGQAAWRPSRGRHNVWELVLHAAYWKYAAWRMLTGQKRGAFPEKGSNWFARPAASPTRRAWRADLALLDAEHRRLRAAVAALPPSALRKRPRGSRYTTGTLVYGVASHDVYHTGQIQMLKRLWKDRRNSR
ncbi:MAG TPA: DinB family protein [Thermoanaerobaculia bacterium]|nr:DinB family protein [Thermoanaerobaculia bacterium]